MIDESGWPPLIELLTAVPTSMTQSTASLVPGEHPDGDDVDVDVDGDGDSYKQLRAWPRASLTSAFNCIKLIVDDFIDLMPLEAVKRVLVCLYNFAAQSLDVNMSLVAIEMLWKVGDLSMSSRSPGTHLEEHTASVLDVMMQRLLILSTDARPEVRNCGT